MGPFYVLLSQGSGDWSVGPDQAYWQSVEVVPEPSTFALVGIAAVGLLGYAGRRLHPHILSKLQ